MNIFKSIKYTAVLTVLLLFTICTAVFLPTASVAYLAKTAFTDVTAGTSTFAVSFAGGMQTTDEIQVWVNGVENTSASVVWLSGSTLQLVGYSPAAGDDIEFRRVSPKTDNLVDLEAGKTIRASSLMKNFRHVLQIGQEAVDAASDMLTIADDSVDDAVQAAIEAAASASIIDPEKHLYRVSNMFTLGSTPATTYTAVYLEGHTTASDGGQGTFLWDAASTATDDNGTIRAVTGVATGRWIRQFDRLYINYFGAIGNDSTVNTAAIQAALNYANSSGRKAVYARAGIYRTGKINWPGNNISLIGEGPAYSYTSAADPTTVLKAVTDTTIILDLVQTGLVVDREGNLIKNLMIDGANIASIGIDLNLSNIIDNCKVTRCIVAGIQLANATNNTRVTNTQCRDNSGWGIKILGPSSTIFSIDHCMIGSNTLGGIYAEGGLGGNISQTVIESNAGPGFRIYRDNSSITYLGRYTFDNVWFEDNAATAGSHVIEIRSGYSDIQYSPAMTIFQRCHFSVDQGRKLADLRFAKYVQFLNCDYYLADQTDETIINVTGGCSEVHFLTASTPDSVSLSAYGFSQRQIDAFMESSMGGGEFRRNYFHTPNVKCFVGKTRYAGDVRYVAFQNSWVNVGGSEQAAAFYFDASGNLCLQGTISTGASGTVAFTLPAGYWPSRAKRFVIDGNGAYARLDVSTAGDVTITGTGVGTRASFDVSFSLAY